MKNIFPILIALLFSACSKEIEIDYRDIEPIFVVEGTLSNENVQVFISQTRNMESNIKNVPITSANVIMKTSNGNIHELSYQTDSFYRPAIEFTPQIGETYTLELEIEGENFSSNSFLNEKVEIQNTQFYWESLMGERILFFKIQLQDPQNTENFYYAKIFRNGELYASSVFSDKGIDGGIISEDYFCMMELMVEENEEDNQDMILRDGDIIDVELRAIDQKSYDYIYSLDLGTNPIPNFSGNCLGYFSAFSVARTQLEYQSSKVI